MLCINMLLFQCGGFELSRPRDYYSQPVRPTPCTTVAGNRSCHVSQSNTEPLTPADKYGSLRPLLLLFRDGVVMAELGVGEGLIR